MPAHVKDLETLGAWAEELGWVMTDDEPTVLTKLGRTIRIEYNMAGRPNKMQWFGGNEHTQYGAGFTSLTRVRQWMTTELGEPAPAGQPADDDLP